MSIDEKLEERVLRGVFKSRPCSARGGRVTGRQCERCTALRMFAAVSNAFSQCGKACPRVCKVPFLVRPATSAHHARRTASRTYRMARVPHHPFLALCVLCIMKDFCRWTATLQQLQNPL